MSLHEVVRHLSGKHNYSTQLLTAGQNALPHFIAGTTVTLPPGPKSSRANALVAQSRHDLWQPSAFTPGSRVRHRCRKVTCIVVVNDTPISWSMACHCHSNCTTCIQRRPRGNCESNKVMTFGLHSPAVLLQQVFFFLFRGIRPWQSFLGIHAVRGFVFWIPMLMQYACVFTSRMVVYTKTPYAPTSALRKPLCTCPLSRWQPGPPVRPFPGMRACARKTRSSGYSGKQVYLKCRKTLSYTHAGAPSDSFQPSPLVQKRNSG